MTPSEKAGDVIRRETAQIQKVALFAFLVNLGLVAIKAVLALGSGSLAVTASTIDSATDSAASLAVYGGLKLSGRKTGQFPYGLYKIENIISIVIAFFIFLAGYEIAKSAFFSEKATPEITLPVILWIGLTLVITLAFGQYAFYVGKKTGSPTLMAEGRHRQADVASSGVVLAALILNYFDISFVFFGITLDHLAAIAVLLFILYAGWELLADGMRVLLDASIDQATLDKIEKVVTAHPAVTGVLKLTGRNAGRFRFIEADISLRTDDLQKAHAITEEIEGYIHKSVPHIEKIVIHYQPTTLKVFKTAVPMNNYRGDLSDHFGDAPYFSLITVNREKNRIEKEEILENPNLHIEKGKGIKTAEWLLLHKVDFIITKDPLYHKGPGYVLSDAGIKNISTSKTKLEDVKASLVSDDLIFKSEAGKENSRG